MIIKKKELMKFILFCGIFFSMCFYNFHLHMKRYKESGEKNEQKNIKKINISGDVMKKIEEEISQINDNMNEKDLTTMLSVAKMNYDKNPEIGIMYFEKLAKYKDGKEIKYAVTEESVVGYKSFIDNFTITNSHDPEKINISGTKVWNDNNDQDGKRPTKITVQVLKGEQVVAEVEVSAETDWKFEFKDLPKYEKGKEITYKLKEVSVEHYTTEVTDKDGKYTITNTHTPAKINVKGQKIWDDANNKDGIRPDSIVVKLLANGVETGKTATASAASGWTYEFTDLDRYQDGGKEIVYAIKEAYVPKGYTSEVIGTNIVNHHKPKDPEPNKPQDPEPNKPKDPEPGKPGQKPQLPNTGEKASNATVVAGLALMVITGGLYFVSRKNK